MNPKGYSPFVDVIELQLGTEQPEAGFHVRLNFPALPHMPHDLVQSVNNNTLSNTEHPGFTMHPGRVEYVLASILEDRIVHEDERAFLWVRPVSWLNFMKKSRSNEVKNMKASDEPNTEKRNEIDQ
jgi:hypothetical protein